MFPLFEPISWFMMYTFWVTIAMCFFLFLWMLKKLSTSFWYNYMFFKKYTLWYFLTVFFFSSLFFVMWKRNDLKYMKNPFEFFMMSDYNFSLTWALVWFFAVLTTTMMMKKESLNNYMDWLTISLLFVLFMGFMWAFLWWQVYGSETLFGMEMLYTHPFTPVPFQVPVFPLPIVYSMLMFMLFSLSYIASMYIHIKWFIWYVWLMMFWSIMLMFDFFSWKYDMFKDYIWINMSQTFSIFLIIFCAYSLFLMFKSNENKEQSIM